MPRRVRITDSYYMNIWHIWDLMIENLRANEVNMYSDEYNEKQKALDNARGGLLNLLHHPPEDLEDHHFLEDDEINTLHNFCVGLAFGFKGHKNTL